MCRSEEEVGRPDPPRRRVRPPVASGVHAAKTEAEEKKRGEERCSRRNPTRSTSHPGVPKPPEQQQKNEPPNPNARTRREQDREPKASHQNQNPNPKAQNPTGSELGRFRTRKAQNPRGSEPKRLRTQEAQNPRGSEPKRLRTQEAQNPRRLVGEQAGNARQREEHSRKRPPHRGGLRGLGPRKIILTAPWSAFSADTRRPKPRGQLAYARRRSARSPWRSFAMTSRSICRTRSRDSPNDLPIWSRVRGWPSSRP
ncbi:hypothetical protein SAMN05216215_1009115 [Saccharopolyspora shandongensis]|uniref:Uncharacterized protein n=1 Tax=Saccharopolyspora shandongensis TaxID=418495 RepID=A0A1H3AGK8_9PSEU|nr:hypothetical protein SAMN05216215_1009115 [Saccharopolyspora shandongensis]